MAQSRVVNFVCPFPFTMFSSAMRSPYWSIELRISRIRAWRQDINAAPSVDFIPALQRRRLSAMARINLQLAHDLNPTQQALRCVFASRHGEIGQTVSMLQSLARNELLSPAAFSHSVHNATQGLWSIHTGQTGECSAISAGCDSLAMGFLEVAGMQVDQASPDILLLYSDEVVPEILQPAANETSVRFALGCLIDSGPANFKLSSLPKAAGTSNAELDFFAWWHSDQTQQISSGEQCNWEWTRL